MKNHSSTKYDFSNRIVLVTGGTGALGSSITKAFVESNATVISSYISDREKEHAQQENKSIVQLVKANITKEDEVIKLVSNIIDEYSRIDILVNVVGAYIGGKSVSELEEEESPHLSQDKISDIKQDNNKNTNRFNLTILQT